MLGDERQERMEIEKRGRQIERLGQEDRIGLALKTGEEICAQVRCWADEIIHCHEDVRDDETDETGTEPRSDETFHSLFWGQLKQLVLAK